MLSSESVVASFYVRSSLFIGYGSSPRSILLLLLQPGSTNARLGLFHPIHTAYCKTPHVSLFLLPFPHGSFWDYARTERLVLGLFILSVVLLVFSALSFTSALFRYEIRAWSFLGFLSIIADLLLVISCILALLCRVRFGIALEQFPVCKPICGSRGSLKTD
ncbi:hypothetical protein BKA83DRAFT_1636647 [Pisolithus microcarpus]|nr:hypothetical protein BKA83DRAFT_1636647 [Pisolithus microcarpus]